MLSPVDKHPHHEDLRSDVPPQLRLLIAKSGLEPLDTAARAYYAAQLRDCLYSYTRFLSSGSISTWLIIPKVIVVEIIAHGLCFGGGDSAEDV